MKLNENYHNERRIFFRLLVHVQKNESRKKLICKNYEEIFVPIKCTVFLRFIIRSYIRLQWNYWHLCSIL